MPDLFEFVGARKGNKITVVLREITSDFCFY